MVHTYHKESAFKDTIDKCNDYFLQLQRFYGKLASIFLNISIVESNFFAIFVIGWKIDKYW